MYKAAAAQAPVEGAPSATAEEAPKAQDEGVIDAEYVDVDKK